MEIKLDPVSRVEGHMRVLLDVENGIVKEARCSSTLFRGFEKVLINQEPRRAACFTTRICGFCPTSHAMAGAGALDRICGVSDAIPADAILARNIIQGLDFISNHLTHLYLLWLPDLVNPAYKEVISQNLWEEFTKRFAPPACRINNVSVPMGRSYAPALHTRKLLQEAILELSGKEIRPIAGGLDIQPSAENIQSLSRKHHEVMQRLSSLLGSGRDDWIENTYLAAPGAAVGYLEELCSDKKDFSQMGDFELIMATGTDVLGRPESLMLDKCGCHDSGFLSFGCFPADDGMVFRQGFLSPGLEYSSLDINKITEDSAAAFYTDDKCHPYEGKTETLPADGISYGSKYTWTKAPRYNGAVCEVGSLARLLVAGEPLITGIADMFRKKGLPVANVYTRIMARIQEMLISGYLLEKWIKELNPHGIYKTQAEKPLFERGFGIWEAPRGALGHWICLKNGLVSNYQIITPTTWNASPGGVIEKSLVGSPICAMGNRYGIDCSNPVTALHIVRSFDPCNGCAVHVIGSRLDSIKLHS
ncbi:MAG: nickel-dependent hydrogenase large subunit [Candidatus Methanoperedens sp.]|nr:nickel-dependent hydrogenase large subunit [Candidatus Methanoperedens sp.]